MKRFFTHWLTLAGSSEAGFAIGLSIGGESRGDEGVSDWAADFDSLLEESSSFSGVEVSVVEAGTGGGNWNTGNFLINADLSKEALLLPEGTGAFWKKPNAGEAMLIQKTRRI